MKKKKIWIFFGIIILILLLNHKFGWSSFISNLDNLKFASIVLTSTVNNDKVIVTKTAIAVSSIVYARRKLEDNLK